jgi:hypothetical protein
MIRAVDLCPGAFDPITGAIVNRPMLQAAYEVAEAETQACVRLMRVATAELEKADTPENKAMFRAACNARHAAGSRAATLVIPLTVYAWSLNVDPITGAPSAG